MITGDTIKIFRELIKKIGLEDWTINLSTLSETSIIQFKENKFHSINDFCWGITYYLPTSKIAEIYIVEDKQEFKWLLAHELLHVKYAPEISKMRYSIESNFLISSDQREKELNELDAMEHEVIELFLPTYLK